MAVKHPPIQLVDEEDNPTKGSSMQAAHQKGLRHRVVVVLVEDDTGRVLLQKRSDKVSTYKNSWDVSAAGHVDYGEDYLTAAKRELQEELGISGYELEEVEHIYSEEKLDDGRQLNRFRKFYKVSVPHDLDIKFDPEEISEIRWFTLPELEHFFIQSDDQRVDDLQAIYSRHYKLS